MRCAPEHDGSRNGQSALGILVGACRRALGLFDLFQDAPGRFNVQSPCLGEAQPAAGAVQHPRFEMGLELGNSPAHRGKRYAELPGSGRKASSLHNRQQYRHRPKLIHDQSSQIQQTRFSNSNSFHKYSNHISLKSQQIPNRI